MSRQVFTVLNDLITKGIIQSYALGGAVGFMVWTQPFLTNDTDFFVQIHTDGLLVSLAPVYQYAKLNGFHTTHEYIVIDGEKVQIIPSPSKLIDEAIATAQPQEIEGEIVSVMLPEYLICTALAAGRLKDFAKIEKMLAEATVDPELLKKLIHKFNLTGTWKRYCTSVGTVAPEFAHLAATKLAWRREEASMLMQDKLIELKKLRTKSLMYQVIRYKRV